MKAISPTGDLDSGRQEAARHPTFREAFLFWLKLGFISFGGPTGQIAVMHTELVEKSLWLGSSHTVVQEGIFFSKAAMVTFGGAYAVLPYVAQQAVQTHHWLSAGQILDG